MERFRYVPGEYAATETFDRLKGLLAEADLQYGTAGNRVYYLATVPSVFSMVAEALAKEGCNVPGEHGDFARMVVEKPYGRDLDSALDLDRAVHNAFDEGQIFRIDHYMGKETVQNVLALRFANAIFEPMWNRRYVEQVQITVAEEPGGRAPRRLLRDGRGPARHRPGPRHAGAGPHLDGAAHRHGRRPHPRREGEAAQGRRTSRPPTRRSTGRSGPSTRRG